jgi:hypothetical protein
VESDTLFVNFGASGTRTECCVESSSNSETSSSSESNEEDDGEDDDGGSLGVKNEDDGFDSS